MTVKPLNENNQNRIYYIFINNVFKLGKITQYFTFHLNYNEGFGFFNNPEEFVSTAK